MIRNGRTLLTNRSLSFFLPLSDPSLSLSVISLSLSDLSL